MFRFLLSILCTVLISLYSFAGKRYVSISGNNANNGLTIATAYRTIKFAVTQTPIGDTLMVIASTTPYNENGILITTSITVRKTGSGEAIIDATGLTFSPAVPFIIAVSNVSNVTIDSLTIRNGIYGGAKGIWVLRSNTGSTRMRNILIKNCTISNIGWISNDLKAPQYNSAVSISAIKIDGGNAVSLSSVMVTNNKIKNCAVGWGECITVTGNVDTFRVFNNAVDSISGIGVAVAGNYSSTGAPSAVNQARNGVVSGNSVSNCMSSNATTAGIYIDGGTKDTIENNRCFRNGTGLSLGAEQFAGGNLITLNVIRNNLVYDNSLAGIFIGSNVPNNGVTRNYVLNNTFFKNVTAAHINGIDSLGLPGQGRNSVEFYANSTAGEVLLQNNANDTFQNNIIYPALSRRAIVGMGAMTTAGFGSNYNLYFHDDGTPLFFFASGSSFNGLFNISPTSSISDFTTATGQEANSLFGSPVFISPNSFNLDLSSCSFAINKGNPVNNNLLYGQIDFSGVNQRIYSNVRVDCGAYEYQNPQVLCAFNLRTPVSVCSGTINQIKLSWSPSANATGYDVYRNSVNISSVTDTLYTDLPGGPGTYNYIVKAKLGTQTLDNANGVLQVVVSSCIVTAVIDPATNPYEIRVFPNPVRNNIYISANNVAGKEITIVVINDLGQTILIAKNKSLASDFRLTLNAGNFAAGSYLLQVNIGSKAFSMKMIKL